MESLGREPTLRLGRMEDLEAVNRLIEDAISGWHLPERVKRLSIPLYKYDEHDLNFLELMLAEDSQGQIMGVAGWEPADDLEAPANQTALLLHGIFVVPDQQHRGIGTLLFEAAERAARSHGFSGVLVKAQAGAEGFFQALGLTLLPVLQQHRDYPHRFWKSVGETDNTQVAAASCEAAQI